MFISKIYETRKYILWTNCADGGFQTVWHVCDNHCYLEEISQHSSEDMYAATV